MVSDELRNVGYKGTGASTMAHFAPISHTVVYRFNVVFKFITSWRIVVTLVAYISQIWLGMQLVRGLMPRLLGRGLLAGKMAMFPGNKP